LEGVPGNFTLAAQKLLEQVESALPGQLRGAPITGAVRFADNLPAASGVYLGDHGQAALIPAEWSMVFCDSYVGQVVKKAAEEKRFLAEKDIRQALVALLASFLLQASEISGSFSVAN